MLFKKALVVLPKPPPTEVNIHNFPDLGHSAVRPGIQNTPLSKAYFVLDTQAHSRTLLLQFSLRYVHM